MPWPDWIETLRARFLSDEASVFLVLASPDDRWEVDGRVSDAAGVLVRFLSTRREIVGVITERDGLSFPEPTDGARLGRLVEAVRALDGTRVPDADGVAGGLARAWVAMGAAGTAQAYVLPDAHRFLPARRKRQAEVPGAPALPEWPRHERLRSANHVLVAIAPAAEEVVPAFVAAASAIRAEPAPAASPEVPADPVLEGPDPLPEPPGALGVVGDVGDRVAEEPQDPGIAAVPDELLDVPERVAPLAPAAPAGGDDEGADLDHEP